MPETKIVLCREQWFYNKVNQDIQTGWELHPQTGRLVIDGVGVVYHLIKYASPEEKRQFLALLEPAKPEVADVSSIINVDINEADGYLKDGYKLMVQPTASSKTVILAKTASPTEAA